MSKIYQNKKLRKLIIPLLKKLNIGNITIKHHYTGSKFKLDAFVHKGYWYHGKNREKAQMDQFRQVIREGDIVLELGAHIGYISNYFSNLVGLNGKVYVFEPGVNNLPYARENLASAKIKNITLIEKAVSDTNGTASFYLENITGQSNSLVKDYKVTKKIHSKTFTDLKKKEVEVETIRIDDFITQNNISTINFIKMDIEGAEFLAIKGMSNLISTQKPTMMIEITENHQTLFDLLKNYGYVFIDDCSRMVEESKAFYGNLFCIHSSNQATLKELLGKS